MTKKEIFNCLIMSDEECWKVIYNNSESLKSYNHHPSKKWYIYVFKHYLKNNFRIVENNSIENIVYFIEGRMFYHIHYYDTTKQVELVSNIDYTPSDNIENLNLRHYFYIVSKISSMKLYNLYEKMDLICKQMAFSNMINLESYLISLNRES